MNKQMLIKVAQINKAVRHELRARMLKRAGFMMNIRKATPEEEEIQKLKKIRDSYGLWDMLKGMGIGGLAGAGLGTGSSLALSAGQQFIAPNSEWFTTLNALWFGGGLGSIAGGVKGAIDHAQKRQRAIERLKELGVEDTIEK